MICTALYQDVRASHRTIEVITHRLKSIVGDAIYTAIFDSYGSMDGTEIEKMMAAGVTCQVMRH